MSKMPQTQVRKLDLMSIQGRGPSWVQRLRKLVELGLFRLSDSFWTEGLMLTQRELTTMLKTVRSTLLVEMAIWSLLRYF